MLAYLVISGSTDQRVPVSAASFCTFLRDGSSDLLVFPKLSWEAPGIQPLSDMGAIGIISYVGVSSCAGSQSISFGVQPLGCFPPLQKTRSNVSHISNALGQLQKMSEPIA